MNPISTSTTNNNSNITVNTTAGALGNLRLSASNYSQGRSVVTFEPVARMMVSEPHGAVGGYNIRDTRDIRVKFQNKVDGLFSSFRLCNKLSTIKSGMAGTPSFAVFLTYIQEEMLSIDEIEHVLGLNNYKYSAGCSETNSCPLFTHEEDALNQMLVSRKDKLICQGINREQVSSIKQTPIAHRDNMVRSKRNSSVDRKRLELEQLEQEQLQEAIKRSFEDQGRVCVDVLVPDNEVQLFKPIDLGGMQCRTCKLKFANGTPLYLREPCLHGMYCIDHIDNIPCDFVVEKDEICGQITDPEKKIHINPA